MNFKYGRAICYSGYREGQSPIEKKYPSYNEVKEDLTILSSNFDYLRLYDPSQHAKTVLDVIKKEGFNFKVMIGIDLLGEISNPDCQWGGLLTEDQINANVQYNENQLEALIALANQYPEIVFAVSAGNEAVPEWNENLVSPERVLYFVKALKKAVKQPVTYCENNHYWISHLQEVVKHLDFISLHTYPVWLGKRIDEAFSLSVKDYQEIASFYDDKPCIITETGWPTKSNGRIILPQNAGEEFQNRFVKEMQSWSQENQVLLFFFEAFDEPWKGSNNPDEPEKHWGFYDVTRKPKRVIAQ